MRITAEQAAQIKQLVAAEAGNTARVKLFGSRADDNARGGDVDLLIETTTAIERPAVLMGRIAGRVSRMMDGRRVDVVLAAPNLKRQAIHEIARRTGVEL